MKSKVIVFILFLLSSETLLAGKHDDGFVRVIDDNQWGPKYSMIGAMNVRYNPSSADAYVSVRLNYGGYRVLFYAQDDEGDTFYCGVTQGEPLFERAYEISKSLRNGMSVFAKSNTIGGECIIIGNNTSSTHLD